VLPTRCSMGKLEMEIGTIGNYYGGLSVLKEDGKFFWGIENWDGTHWEEIPESLFNTLIEYENNREKES